MSMLHINCRDKICCASIDKFNRFFIGNKLLIAISATYLSGTTFRNIVSSGNTIEETAVYYIELLNVQYFFKTSERMWHYIPISLFIVTMLVNNVNCGCSVDKDVTYCNSADSSTLFYMIYSCNMLWKPHHQVRTIIIIKNSYLSHLDFNSIPFTDPLTKLAIINSEIETVQAGGFALEDLTFLTHLDLSFNKIKDISFLENLSIPLHTLNVSHNELQSIGTELLELQSLHVLDLSYCKIESIGDYSFKSLHLITLDLSHNVIRNLNLSLNFLIELEDLDISFNYIEEVSKNNIGALRPRKINTSNNRIKYIDTTMFNFQFDYFETCTIVAKFNNLSDISYFQNIKTVFSVIDFSNSNVQKIVWNNPSMKVKSLLDLSDNILSEWEINAIAFISDETLTINLSNASLTVIESNKFNGFTNLDQLILNNNNFQELNNYAFNNTVINELYLCYCGIKVISDETFFGSKIDTLHLNNNKLTRIVGELPMKLRTIHLSFNLLTEIEEFSFPNLPLLKQLNVSHCKIKMIHPRAFKSLKQLSVLDLSHNLIKNLNPNLFHGFTSIGTLDLSYNEIPDLGTNSFMNASISILKLKGLRLSEIKGDCFNGLKELRNLDLSNNGIVSLNSNSFNGLYLQTLNLSNNNITIIPSNFLGNTKHLNDLNLRENDIYHISEDAFFYKCELQNLNLKHVEVLKDKSFMKLINLKTLGIYNSRIKVIQNGTFTGLINLEKLQFSNSIVYNIEPGAFYGLEKLTDLDSKGLFKNISSLKPYIFNGLDSLEHLDLSGLNIKIIQEYGFAGLTTLKQLWLNNNNITQLEQEAFFGLDNLLYLNLAHNNLTGSKRTFPVGIFRNLRNLHTLNLEFNGIRIFQAGEFSNLYNLKFLDLSHNRLSALDIHVFFPFKRLEVLSLNANNIHAIDYTSLTLFLINLRSIGIGSNRWACEKLVFMLNKFKENAVNYTQNSILQFDYENIDGIRCIDICNYMFCPSLESNTSN